MSANPNLKNISRICYSAVNFRTDGGLKTRSISLVVVPVKPGLNHKISNISYQSVWEQLSTTNGDVTRKGIPHTSFYFINCSLAALIDAMDAETTYPTTYTPTSLGTFQDPVSGAGIAIANKAALESFVRATLPKSFIDNDLTHDMPSQSTPLGTKIDLVLRLPVFAKIPDMNSNELNINMPFYARDEFLVIVPRAGIYAGILVGSTDPIVGFQGLGYLNFNLEENYSDQTEVKPEVKKISDEYGADDPNNEEFVSDDFDEYEGVRNFLNGSD